MAIFMVFWRFFEKNAYFWRENGRGRHAGAKGSGASRPDQNVDSRGGVFGKMFSNN